MLRFWRLEHVDLNRFVSKQYGTDAVRYYLLREGVLGSDGDFKLSLLENRLSGELADTLGNLGKINFINSHFLKFT